MTAIIFCVVLFVVARVAYRFGYDDAMDECVEVETPEDVQ